MVEIHELGQSGRLAIYVTSRELPLRESAPGWTPSVSYYRDKHIPVREDGAVTTSTTPRVGSIPVGPGLRCMESLN